LVYNPNFLEITCKNSIQYRQV